MEETERALLITFAHSHTHAHVRTYVHVHVHSWTSSRTSLAFDRAYFDWDWKWHAIRAITWVRLVLLLLLLLFLCVFWFCSTQIVEYSLPLLLLPLCYLCCLSYCRCRNMYCYANIHMYAIYMYKCPYTRNSAYHWYRYCILNLRFSCRTTHDDTGKSANNNQHEYSLIGNILIYHHRRHRHRSVCLFSF